ncbi:type IV pili twitching motility protein PilT [Candidatus Nomurabacteria bacterium RIFCSPLOWO2_01_FULL_36_10b]|uniref:Type IV pili twitching motility protein PilT n=1 Tax=Candidatus Nomurabacteria bacterium RIFCSPLOWO2_01_FULL_36_10b TaxID=1801766 RepID=A0A1F6WN90_9BACT|nr:MAG: type IV pili twitching motility protein PilT [Candidatus Nomurabacteria bacterium RIFCSPLOWO2_01_FULL_36_10b]
MIESLLDIIKAEGASDLHLSVGRRPCIRVNGELTQLMNQQVLDQTSVLTMLVELVGDARARQVLEHTELDFSYDYTPAGMRFRGSAYIQTGHVAVALRSIDKIKTLAELGLPEVLADFARREQGFFLVVGPVGQGKSTTLAAMIDLINTERKEHIVTIENPIEYIFEEKNSIIEQREVGIDTHSFQSGLESSFRQDVNVIMIGEMRNPETVSTAVTAAETGHLVISTLHTNSASQTIDRIIDLFDGYEETQIRNQLSSSLIGIFSQRLVTSLKGGRVPAYELLINNPAVSNLIREGRTHEIDSVIETSAGEGMVTMNHSLLELIRQGHITLDDAMRHSLNPEGLKRLVS